MLDNFKFCFTVVPLLLDFVMSLLCEWQSYKCKLFFTLYEFVFRVPEGPNSIDHILLPFYPTRDIPDEIGC